MRRAVLLIVPCLLCVGCSGKGDTQASKPTRVSVKHGLDKDAGKVARTPKKLSIAELLAMRAPSGVGDLSSYPESRVAPFETSTYEIEGTIKSVVHRKDGDYYLVVENEKGDQAVVEVPDPKLCKGSPLEADIERTRKSLEDRYHPSDKPKEVNERASIRGVGFFGWKGKPGSGSTSSKPRLMPGTGITFDDKPSG